MAWLVGALRPGGGRWCVHTHLRAPMVGSFGGRAMPPSGGRRARPAAHPRAARHGRARAPPTASAAQP
eukprot:354857-Chlamydomonas_euryale.AAC.34